MVREETSPLRNTKKDGDKVIDNLKIYLRRTDFWKKGIWLFSSEAGLGPGKKSKREDSLGSLERPCLKLGQ